MLARRKFLASVGAACLMAGTFGTAGAQDTTNLTVAFPSPGGLGYFAFYNAIGEGYFEEEGITVEPQSVNGSAAVIQALLAGQAQLGHPGPGPTLNAREGGADIVYIYNYFAKSQFNLVVEADSGYETPEDLRGKVIGVGTADGAEVAFVRSIFDAAGMSEGTDYTFITVGEGGMAVAGFMNDEIDAYAADTSGTATLRLRGVDLDIITPDEFRSFFGNGYVVTREFLEANRDVIEGFGRALVRGTRFAQDPANREAMLEHAAMGNPQQLEDLEFANALLDTYLDLTAPVDMSNGFGYQAPASWEMWQNTLVASGDLDGPLPDLEAAYTNEFVEAWNAE